MKRKVTTELCPSGAGGLRLPREAMAGLGRPQRGVQGAVSRPVPGQLPLPKGTASAGLRAKEPVLLYRPRGQRRASGARPLRSRWRRPALRLGVRQGGGLQRPASGLPPASQGLRFTLWAKGGGEAVQPSSGWKRTGAPAWAILPGEGTEVSGPEPRRLAQAQQGRFPAPLRCLRQEAMHPQAALKQGQGAG